MLSSAVKLAKFGRFAPAPKTAPLLALLSPLLPKLLDPNTAALLPLLLPAVAEMGEENSPGLPPLPDVAAPPNIGEAFCPNTGVLEPKSEGLGLSEIENICCTEINAF